MYKISDIYLSLKRVLLTKKRQIIFMNMPFDMLFMHFYSLFLNNWMMMHGFNFLLIFNIFVFIGSIKILIFLFSW